MMTRIVRFMAIMTLAALSLTPESQAALVFYTDSGAFSAAAGSPLNGYLMPRLPPGFSSGVVSTLLSPSTTDVLVTSSGIASIFNDHGFAFAPSSGSSVEFNFTTSATAFGFTAASDNSGNMAELQVFDPSGILLGSQSTGSLWNTQFLGVVTTGTTRIGRVVVDLGGVGLLSTSGPLQPDGSPDRYADTTIFQARYATAAVVPEPSTLISVTTAAALLGLNLVWRRRKREGGK